MLQIRRAGERGHFNHGWLDTYHTFSFADYYDPKFMGYRDLRVINEDRVAPGQGFGTHGHRDMEIVTYVLEGALEHKDSMGNGSVIRPGDIQRMSAGTGVTHSEFNHSKLEGVHFLQIWILPAQLGQKPSYEQQALDVEALRKDWKLIVSPEGREHSVTVHQEVSLWATRIDAGQDRSFELKEESYAWVQVLRGEGQLNGQKLKTSDGAAISREISLHFEATRNAEILLFDLK